MAGGRRVLPGTAPRRTPGLTTVKRSRGPADGFAVTATVAPEAVQDDAAAPKGPASRLELVEHAAMAAALAWWGLVLTYHSGGRDKWVLTLGIPLAVAALVACRPWTFLPTRSLATACALVAAVLAVCLVTPTHWYAGSQAATYAYSAVLLIAVRAYARTPGRRTVVVGIVLAVGLAQLGWAFTAWHRLGTPSAPMMGRFFWYNQFAAFELAPAVLGLGLAVRGAIPLRLLAGAAAVLGSTGVLLSTSRASMALLGLGWLAAGVLSLLGAPAGRERLRTLGRLVLLAGLTAATAYLVTGPPFFDHRASPLAATAGRSVAQPVAQNGVYRLDFWQQAVEIFRRHVLSGAGFGSFGRQTTLLDPTAPHAQFVHNGYLQAFSDGGLLLGLPFALAVGGGLLVVLRRLSRRAARQEYGVVALGAVPSCCSPCTAASTSTGAIPARWPRSPCSPGW